MCWIVGVLLWVGGCAQEPEPTAPVPSSVLDREVVHLDLPSGPGAMAPQLTGSGDDLVLTWLEPTEDDRHSLYFTTFDEGWTHGRHIATSDDFFANWADRPAAIRAHDGTLYAHWLRMMGEGTYDYGIHMVRSSDDGVTWQDMGWLHDDATPAEHGFVTYVQEPEGVRAFWLDGRAMPGGGDMQLRTTVVGSSEPSELVDERVCECCSLDSAHGRLGSFVTYRDRSPDEVRDIAVGAGGDSAWTGGTIHDDGWRIAGCPVNGPAIDIAEDRVVIAWHTEAVEPLVQVAFSDSDAVGRRFGEPTTIDDQAPLGRVDVAWIGDDHAAVSWLDATDGGAALRWRWIHVDGTVGPVEQVATTTAQRSAGVPRMIRHDDMLLFVWVDDSGPATVLRSGRVQIPSFG
ncbi:MAG: hypothetical protein AAGD38_08680 [Acidobacteriota bacterium]